MNPRAERVALGTPSDGQASDAEAHGLTRGMNVVCLCLPCSADGQEAVRSPQAQALSRHRPF